MDRYQVRLKGDGWLPNMNTNMMSVMMSNYDLNTNPERQIQNSIDTWNDRRLLYNLGKPSITLSEEIFDKVSGVFINNLRKKGYSITWSDKLLTNNFILKDSGVHDLYNHDDDSVDAMRYAMEDIAKTRVLYNSFYGLPLSDDKEMKARLFTMPERYIINEDAAILFWADGTKTVVKRAEDDEADPVKAFLWAYFQYTSGMTKTKANQYLKEVNDEYYDNQSDTDMIGVHYDENGKLSIPDMLQNVSNAFSKLGKTKKEERK